MTGQRLVYFYDENKNEVGCFLFEGSAEDLLNQDEKIIKKIEDSIDVSQLKTIEELSGGCVFEK